MSDQAQLYLIIAGAVVVLIALLLGRRFLVKWKGGELETGRGGSSMTMTAKGKGSKIEKGTQTSDGSGNDELSMTAKGGGELTDVRQEPGKKVT